MKPAFFSVLSTMRSPLEYPFALNQDGDLTLAAFAAELARLAQEPGMGETVVRLQEPAGTYWNSPAGASVHGVTEGLTGETYLFFVLEPARPVHDHYQDKLDAQKFGDDGTHVHEPITIPLDNDLPF